MPNINTCYMNTKQAAIYTNFAPNTLEKYRSTGAGNGPKYRKVGRKVVYSQADLDEWVGRTYECTADYDEFG